ncbi:MAG: hypothetical protein AAF666_16505 [Pseudomonadota bacterium]
MLKIVSKSFFMSLWPGFVVGIFTVPIAALVFIIWFAVQGFVVPWLVFVPGFGGILTLCASLLVAVFALTIIWVQAARYAVALCRLQMLSRQPSFWSATKASALVLVILQILFWIAGFGLDYTENSVRGATVLVGNVNVDENQIPWSAIWERFRTFLRSAAVAIMALATVPLVATVKEPLIPITIGCCFLCASAPDRCSFLCSRQCSASSPILHRRSRWSWLRRFQSRSW